MAGRRPPLTDKQLRDAELEQQARRLMAESTEGNDEVEAMLAQAGEPEAVAAKEALQDAPDAVAALRAVSKGNIARLRPGDADAIMAGEIAADSAGSLVEDPMDAESAARTLQEIQRKQAQLKKAEETERTMRSRASKVMGLHWKNWSNTARKKDHSKACLNMEFDVGHDAQLLVDGGQFDSHLAVAQFIQRFHVMAATGKSGVTSDDWEEKHEAELKELRGDDD